MKKDKLLRKTVLVCLGLIVAVLSVKADYLPFRKIDVSNGLLNNQPWAIHQLDDHTFLIAYPYSFAYFDGSQSHICRFDARDTYYIKGYEARIFRDKMGRIWTKNYSSLLVYEPMRKNFVSDIQNIWSGSGVKKIDDILFDSEGNAWLYLNGKIYFYDWEHKASLIYISSRKEIKAGVVPVHIVKNDNYAMIVFSDGTIRRFCDGKMVAEETDFVENSQPFLERASLKINREYILLGTGAKRGGLILYNIKTGRYKTVDSSLSRFIDMLYSPQGDIYVICPYEIRVYSRDLILKSKIYGANVTRTFESQAISDAAFDWQGGLWVSTFLGGIYYYHPQSFHNVVHSVKVDKVDNRRLLTSMIDGGKQYLVYSTITDLVGYDISRNEEKLLYHNPEISILSMAKDSTGSIWLGTRQGLFKFDNGQIEKYNASNVKDVPNNVTPCRFVLPVGDRVYCSMGNHPIGWLDPKAREFHAIPVGRGVLPVRQDFWNVAYDKHGHKVLFGGNNCIISYDEKSGRTCDVTQSFHKKGYVFSHANHILVDSKGRYVISSQDALYVMMPKGDIYCYTSADGLPSGSICATSEIANGWYAVSASTGIATFYIDDSHQIHVRRHDISRLTDGNDLASGALVAKGRALWCASVDGIYGVIPNTNSFEADYGKKFFPALTGVVVMNQEVPADGCKSGRQVVSYADKHIHLQYDENFIELHFSACNYIEMAQTTYRYKLDGIDRNWVECNSVDGILRTAYTNLSPGKYNLNLQILDEHGNWTPSTVWTIDIEPPLWLTWWAILLYVILGMGLSYASYMIWKDRHNLLMRLKEKRNHLIIQAKDVKAEDLEITPEDEQFLKKAVRFVENNLQNADYNVESLSADMAINRSHFYRRLRSICGQSPTEFIRTIRLRRAAQLLSESGKTISEITFLCGFNSPAFFRKYFKEAYGMTPSEYKAKSAD